MEEAVSRENHPSTVNQYFGLLAVLFASVWSSANAAPWTLKYEHEMSMIPFDDLVIPIEIKKPALILSNTETGQFHFSNGTMRSVTRAQVVQTANTPSTNATFPVRPTLFISIKGAEAATEDAEVGFPATIQEQFLNFLNLQTNAHHSQYRHFSVTWDGQESNINQVEDLSRYVKSYLSAKAYPWDVVVIGFSRGGIFAHDMTKRLVGHPYIKTLHTILLDPTAATIVGDAYPMKKHDALGTTHYASLFFDGKSFAYFNDVYQSSFATVGDQPISGYDNYGRNDPLIDSTHFPFAYRWVGCSVGIASVSVDPNEADSCLAGANITSTNDNSTRFKRALNDIWARKDTGAFARDGESGYDIIKIKQKHFSIDGSISVADGNVYFSGSVLMDGSQTSINGVVGKDGLDVTSSALMTVVQAQVSADEAAIRTSNEAATVVASVSATGASGYTNVLGVATASTQVDGGQVTVSTGGVLAPETTATVDAGSGDVAITVNGNNITPPSPSSLFKPKVKISF